jgi:hypothetical protein
VRIPRFALLRFSQYSGLQFNRTRPDDDLTQDLLLPDVTYSDWDFDLFEDFEREFRVDLSRIRSPAKIDTVRDWIRFLASMAAMKSDR